MNQKNGKNSLGLDIIFEDLDNPIELFKKWFSKAEESEINDPNAVAIATSNKDNQPNVRMVLLKGLSEKGFVFYTNLNSKKGEELKTRLILNHIICFYNVFDKYSATRIWFFKIDREFWPVLKTFLELRYKLTFGYIFNR